jgi:hypothetical protein
MAFWSLVLCRVRDKRSWPGTESNRRRQPFQSETEDWKKITSDELIPAAGTLARWQLVRSLAMMVDKAAAQVVSGFGCSASNGHVALLNNSAKSLPQERNADFSSK